MNEIKNICVYCASSSQIAPAYFKAAERLGYLLAERKINLIDGAGKVGLMGCLNDTAVETGTMHERKELMAQMSDAVIALPGGCGTMEELMEIITWKQLGLYDKPIVILNTSGFYNPLIEMLEKAIDQHFMRREHESLWEIAFTPDEAVNLCCTIPLWNKEIRKFAEV